MRGKLDRAGRKAILCPATRTWGSQCVIKSCSATSGSSSGSLKPLLLRQRCLATKETVQERQPQNPLLFPSPGILAAALAARGLGAAGDASGGSNKCCHPALGPEIFLSPHECPMGLPKEQSLVIRFGSLGGEMLASGGTWTAARGCQVWVWTP